ncbi:MAG TPA: TPM domain-containing protein [Myxococcota bacterium]|nr:TPM domain-containing protein [Myxococcota bacterium]
MRRASKFFTEAERTRIEQSVAEAEKGTSGEIVPVVATASGDYDRAEDIFGLWLAIASLVVGWWLLLPSGGPGEWSEGALRVSWVELLAGIVLAVAFFILGAGLAGRVGVLRRLFIPRGQMSREVESAAGRAFFEHGLRGTRHSTGIMIYLSLYERMARVTGDRAISEKLTDDAWRAVRDLIISGIKRGKAADGVVAGIRRCGEILAEHFPIEPGDVNELSNELRLID